jgi:hypothetical protein
MPSNGSGPGTVEKNCMILPTTQRSVLPLYLFEEAVLEGLRALSASDGN